MSTKHQIKRTINLIIREKGRFPTLQEMCDLLSYNAEQTQKYMKALAEDGYLEPIGSWYRFSQNNSKTKDIENMRIEKEKDLRSPSLKILDDMLDGVGPDAIPVKDMEFFLSEDEKKEMD